MDLLEQPIIYLGKRDLSFKELIMSLLERGNLKPKYIDLLTSDKNMKLYDQAFTATSANSEVNYQNMEQVGDLSANKFIVSYTYKRFPQIDCPKGLKIAARLRINYGSKQSFYTIADDLGFWQYISASEENRLHDKKKLLEDSLESFLGCTEQILDNKYRPGVGYGIVYDILTNIFDKIHISLDYYDLYDAKTKLKELYDKFKQLGTIAYVNNRKDKLAESSVYQVPVYVKISNNDPRIQPIKVLISESEYINKPQTNWVLLGSGKAAIKADAEQKAAKQGIITMKKKGYEKPIPEEYTLFCD